MKLNVEIKDESQRDELIKQLQEMKFKPKLAESFEELGYIDGWYIGEIISEVLYTEECDSDEENANVYAEAKQSETAKAYAQLTQLMKQANGDEECKVAIYVDIDGDLDFAPSHFTQGRTSLIKLKDVPTARHFLKHHQELLKTFFQLNK